MDHQFQVLLVDDDEIFTFVTRHVLEKFSAFPQVDIFHDSLQALHFLQTGGGQTSAALVPLTGDLLLIDFYLEEMNGLEFIDQARRILVSRNRPVHFCLLTSSIRDQDYEKAAEAGIHHFLSKPLTAEKVDQLLRDIKVEPVRKPGLTPGSQRSR
jgi:CheY-like chemotaxis protein